MESGKFSAILVTLNDEKHLENCLRSLSFCNQIVVIDLGSTDRSREIAQHYATEVIEMEKQPIIEKIYPLYKTLSKNEWIFVLDPDEVFDPLLLPSIQEKISRIVNLGSICIPRINYFRNKVIQGTIWGGTPSVVRVIHKDRVEYPQVVHHGFVLKEGMNTAAIDVPKAAIHHYWVSSYRELFNKHMRYLRHEGESKYCVGSRFGFLRMSHAVWNALIDNLFKSGAWKNGLDEIILSFFYSFYVFASWIALWQYENRRPTHILS